MFAFWITAHSRNPILPKWSLLLHDCIQFMFFWIVLQVLLSETPNGKLAAVVSQPCFDAPKSGHACRLLPSQRLLSQRLHLMHRLLLADLHQPNLLS